MLSRSGNTKTVWIYLGWTGQIKVSNIRFKSISVKSTSFINPKTYVTHGNGKSYTNKTATSTTKGSLLIGTASIPTNINTVRLTDNGLQIYSANHGAWISGATGNLAIKIN